MISGSNGRMLVLTGCSSRVLKNKLILGRQLYKYLRSCAIVQTCQDEEKFLSLCGDGDACGVI